MTTLDQAIFLPVPSCVPWWALTAVSGIAGILLLLVFRVVSDQARIKIVKDRIKAHLLEIRLFRDDPRLVLRAQKDIFLTTLKYLKLTMVPVAVLILPVIYLALHLELFFGYQPLRPGEAALLAVKLDNRVAWDEAQVNVVVPAGLQVETPALRDPRAREIDWRIRALTEGSHEIVVTLGQTQLAKSVMVSSGLQRVTPLREEGSWLTALFVPGETALPHGGPVKAISVQYPPRSFELFGWRMHWLIPFMAITLIAGFALQGVFGVRL